MFRLLPENQKIVHYVYDFGAFEESLKNGAFKGGTGSWRW